MNTTARTIIISLLALIAVLETVQTFKGAPEPVIVTQPAPEQPSAAWSNISTTAGEIEMEMVLARYGAAGYQITAATRTGEKWTLFFTAPKTTDEK